MTKQLTVFGLFVAIAMASLMTGDAQLAGQEKSGKAADGAKAAPAKEAKPRKKPRGRLPAYFADVVTGQQRDSIYGVQAKYNAQIAELRVQIEELISERNQEVEALLSKEQLEAVNKKRAEAKQRREAQVIKRREARLKADAGS